MMTEGKRKTHDFCWINLVTADPDREAEFYARVFRWTYGEMPGVPGGRLILVDGRNAGALMDLAIMPPGSPAAIGVMVKVEDAEASSAKVRALGGVVHGVFDALENGRVVSCRDSNGAPFDLWQPKAKDGFEMKSNAHGAASWFENVTTDPSRALEFYSGLFGWTAEDASSPGMKYTVLKLDERPIAGAMECPASAQAAPPHWATTFAVDGADRTAELARELGGTLCVGPTDIPAVGRFAQVRSPGGVAFGIIEYRDPRWTA